MARTVEKAQSWVRSWKWLILASLTTVTAVAEAVTALVTHLPRH